MTTAYFFDYETAAREAGIAAPALDKLRALVRKDFPNDDMMYELHVLRACMAVKNGRCSLQDVLDDTVRDSGEPSSDAGADRPRGEV
jgi:hypothetical protein